ncbi:aldehyde dehydrogenase family protein [Nocardia sp. KC 131]|uniref:aldehyde dehydrogenase family protein n=1 Tax=Nocardia arseniciresistens TaxID=3392119 RepID=UPI00398F1647
MIYAKPGYFDNPSPIDGEIFCTVARSTAADIDMALEAAHHAAEGWGATSVTERANILNRIADRIENSIEPLAVAESWGNGKPVREHRHRQAGRRPRAHRRGST